MKLFKRNVPKPPLPHPAVRRQQGKEGRRRKQLSFFSLLWEGREIISGFMKRRRKRRRRKEEGGLAPGLRGEEEEEERPGETFNKTLCKQCFFENFLSLIFPTYLKVESWYSWKFVTFNEMFDMSCKKWNVFQCWKCLFFNANFVDFK